MGKQSKKFKRKISLIPWGRCNHNGCKNAGYLCSYPWGGHIWLCADHRPIYGFCFDCGKFSTTEPDPNDTILCDRCAGYYEEWEPYEPAPETDQEHAINSYDAAVWERWHLGEGMSDY